MDPYCFIFRYENKTQYMPEYIYINIIVRKSGIGRNVTVDNENRSFFNFGENENLIFFQEIMYIPTTNKGTYVSYAF